MLTAVNSPIGLEKFNVGSMNYILAHICYESPKYLDNNRKKNRRSAFTILDNGADELGVGLNGDKLAYFIKVLEPDEVILPDVLGDNLSTVTRSLEFLETYSQVLKGISLMGVAQGKTYEEWFECFSTWNKDSRISTIGIPYDIEFDVKEGTLLDFKHKSLRWSENRFNLVQFLLDKELSSKQIHLLGMSSLEEFRKYPRVNSLLRSTDTTAPFAAANEGRVWIGGDSGYKDWSSLDFHKGSCLGVHLYTNLSFYFSGCGDNVAFFNLLHMDVPDLREVISYP